MADETSESSSPGGPENPGESPGPRRPSSPYAHFREGKSRKSRGPRIGIPQLPASAWIGITLLLLFLARFDLWWVRRGHRIEREKAAKEDALIAAGRVHADYKTDPDDLVFLKGEHPMSLKDEQNLKGRTLWVSAGGQMNFYPYNGHSVDFSHPAGLLLGAEKIVIKDAVEQKAPKEAAFRIPQGDAQVLLVFAKPDDAASAGKEYAVAVGDKEGSTVNLLTDQIFFYSDPHQLYSNWGPQVWQAIDQHHAILGMSERQTQMALGQISVPHGDTAGDRSVEFDDQGKPKMITFEKGKATQIRDENR